MKNSQKNKKNIGFQFPVIFKLLKKIAMQFSGFNKNELFG